VTAERPAPATESAGARAAVDPPGHLERLRHAELDPLSRYFSSGIRVLELGGGNGYQASVLHGWGCSVTSLDVDTAPPARYYPVKRYDGLVIPLPAQSVDVVFSSNVLEHVLPARLPALCIEMRRVLTGGGRAIHLLPSPAWRLWSCLSRYGALMKAAAAAPRAIAAGRRGPGGGHARGIVAGIGRLLLPPAHGAYPTAVSELYYYSRRRWTRVFREGGFDVEQVTGAGVFYTDYGLCPRLSISARRRLSRVLGSACHVFVLRPR